MPVRTKDGKSDRFSRFLRYFRKEECELLWTPQTGLRDLMGRRLEPTYTRASTKTFEQGGKLFSAASGAQDPTGRIDPASTNLALQSQTFGTSWTPLRSTVGLNVVAGPDGSTTADSIIEDTTVTSTHQVSQTAISVVSGTTYTFSCYIKAGTRSWFRLSLSSTRFGAGVSQGAYFNAATGAKGVVTAASTSRITPLGNSGWYRAEITSTCDSTGITNIFIQLALTDNMASYSGDGVSYAYATDVQMEAGKVASPRKITTTLAVTTAADVLQYTLGLPLANSSSERTYFIYYNQMHPLASYPDTIVPFFHSMDVTGASEDYVLAFKSTTTWRFFVQAAGATAVDCNIGTNTDVGRHVMVLSVKSGKTFAAVDGAQTALQAGTFASNGTDSRFRIGCSDTANVQLGMEILCAGVLPRAISQQELTRLTFNIKGVAGYAPRAN